MEYKCEILDSIFENSIDGVVFCNKEGTILLWNSGCQRIFGYTVEEAVGNKLDIIIPEKYRKKHWDGFYRAVETKVSRHSKEIISVPAVNKGGESLSIDFSIVIVNNSAGELLGFGAIIRDVTQSFLEKKNLKKEIEILKMKLNQ